MVLSPGPVLASVTTPSIGASLLQLRRLRIGGRVVCTRTQSLNYWHWDITDSFWGVTRPTLNMEKLRQNCNLPRATRQVS